MQKGKEIGEKYPQFLPILRVIKKLFFTKHHFSWWEAVEEFLKMNKNFVVDQSKEKFLLTWNPNGYLKKTQ